ncbi:MAG: dUTP diphosphatase [Leptotrichiaceae bacterium]|nr:dUTP diphosphatase [Leptotrichiaceae bacterium]
MTYLVVAEAMGYTEEEIEEEYKRKHRINLERINKKREEGGWL